MVALVPDGPLERRVHDVGAPIQQPVRVRELPARAREPAAYGGRHAYDADLDAEAELPAHVVLQLGERRDARGVDERHRPEVPDDDGQRHLPHDDAARCAQPLETALRGHAPRPLRFGAVPRALHRRVHELHGLERLHLVAVRVREEERVPEPDHYRVVGDRRPARVLRHRPGILRLLRGLLLRLRRRQRRRRREHARERLQRARGVRGAASVDRRRDKRRAQERPRDAPPGRGADADLRRHEDGDPEGDHAGDEVGEGNAPVPPDQG